MAFAVVFQAGLEEVPVHVRATLRDRLLDVGAVLETIPDQSVVMESMAQSPMRLDVDGWRFGYKVDPLNHRLLVAEVAKLKSAR